MPGCWCWRSFRTGGLCPGPWRGIRRASRIPTYTGLAVGLLTGPALWAGTWWPIALLPVWVLAVLVLVILPEEAHLRTRFPVEYAYYRNRVRRWL